QHLFERRTVHQLHVDECGLAFIGDVVNGDDVRMRKDARRLRLAKQALAQPFAFGFVRQFAPPDALDGDHPAYCRVLRLIDDAHGAPPELADDLIATDLLHVGPQRRTVSVYRSVRRTRSKVKRKYDISSP